MTVEQKLMMTNLLLMINEAGGLEAEVVSVLGATVVLLLAPQLQLLIIFTLLFGRCFSAIR